MKIVKTFLIVVIVLCAVICSKPEENNSAGSVQLQPNLMQINTNTEHSFIKNLPKYLYSGCIIDVQINKNTQLRGVVNCVQESVDNVTRIGGSFEQGSFCYCIDNKNVSGFIFLNDEVFELPVTPLTSIPVYIKRNIDSVMCNNHPDSAATITSISNYAVPPQRYKTIPLLLSSRPNSINTIYLEFNGVKVQDPMWNAGKIINALSPQYTDEQIKTIYAVIAERYAAFDVNVTTDISFYTKSKVSSRTRVIFTPTNDWFLGAGGVAFIGTFKNAGTGIWSPTIPCWVFTQAFGADVKDVAEAATHEIGHTLSLEHDGTSADTYYYGQGQWAPVMGCAYNKTIVQFSKGDYLNANCKQDDISAIRNALKMPVLTNTSSPVCILSNGSIATGTLASSNDIKVYSLNVVKSGTVTFTALPTIYSGVDLTLQLINKNGILLKTENTIDSQSASITSLVTNGTYYVRIMPSGNTSVTNGLYSSYGSIGTFTITGTLK